MGYYARGDSRKMISSSEDDEGYENQLASATRNTELLTALNIRDRHLISGILGDLPAPSSPVSDDADRPFWAEDELSSSESKLRLNEKQKRRHSLSYRNRNTVHRSRSLIFQSHSSSSDSTRARTSLIVRKGERCNRQPVRQHTTEHFQTKNITRKVPFPSNKATCFKNKNARSKCQCGIFKKKQTSNSILTDKEIKKTLRKEVSTSSTSNGSQSHWNS